MRRDEITKTNLNEKWPFVNVISVVNFNITKYNEILISLKSVTILNN